VEPDQSRGAGCPLRGDRLTGTTDELEASAVLQNSNRVVDPLLLVLVAGLTLATAYIHYWVGGTMLVLNAAGYMGLLAGVALTALVLRRALPLVLMALAAYAGATIVGWLVIGPYFDVAYLAKAIEVALISSIGVYLLRHRTETRAAIRWALGLVSTTSGRLRGRPASSVAGRAPATAGDE
jgi:hypothetical protein